MKILQVLPAYALRYGGPVVAVHSLCRALVARGHDVDVITTNADGVRASDVPLGQPVWRDGVRIRYFATGFARRVFRAPTMGPALRAEMASFDAVHLHQLYQWPGWAAARAAAQLSVPYVVSPRGMLVKDMIRRRNRLAKTAWIRLFDGATLARAAAIHATSELEQAELESFHLAMPRIVTIANGVDDPADVAAAAHPDAVDVVAADVAAATANGPVVMYLGRLSWKKGLDRLLHAFAHVPLGRLVIAGPDDEGRAAMLGALARDIGIGDRVHIVPRTVSGPDKEALFAAARVFVLPSYSENFGNTVLEAMRRGVPVIVTPQVGAADIVRRAGGGVVTGGEAAVLSHALARFMHHPALARSMGAAGRAHVIEHYGWPRIAEQMERLYESVRS